MQRVNNNISELASVIMDGKDKIHTLYGIKTHAGIKDMIFNYLRDIACRENSEELIKFLKEY